MSTVAVSTPITVSLRPPAAPFRRADLDFHGVDHSRSSFTARLFFNQPDADASTPTDDEHGYAGSFHIFGHGGCAGDAGHCETPTERRPYDLRPEHPLTGVTKRVVVTEPLRRALQQGGKELALTVVPVLREELVASYGETLTSDVLHFDRVDLLTYQ
ncbi:MAG: hypothetical protein ACRDQ5_03435 [Sciscionella sp.]